MEAITKYFKHHRFNLNIYHYLERSIYSDAEKFFTFIAVQSQKYISNCSLRYGS